MECPAPFLNDMPYTLDKLKEVRTCLDRGDTMGACETLAEIIEKKQRQWDEFQELREVHQRQHNLNCMEAENDNARTENQP